jgi:regulatory protein YycH of two-component signal transduction system YycFG
MFFYREIMQNIIKNWYQKQVLSGSLATNISDFFGNSVSMNSAGDRIIVGAERDERISGADAQGLAYIYVSGTGGWTQQHILSGTLAIESDFFGVSVAMNSTGDRVIVGAYADERSGGSGSSGLAYVFVSGAGGWTEQSILSGSLATNSGDQFGWSVAMNSTGDCVVVGSVSDERSGGATSEGLAYVFVSGAGGWTEQHILSGTLATQASDRFGCSVAINSIGDRIVVGAEADERSGSNSTTNSEGRAYVFVSGTGGWTEQHILSGSLATSFIDQFGNSVAMNSAGDRIIVGAEQDERNTGSQQEGLAYVFVSGTSGWIQQHILSGSLATNGSDNFGHSVAMNSTGDRLIVGAYLDERISGSSGEGLAYVFVSGTGGWTQQHILSGTLATDATDYFGWSVAMNSTGDRVVVGARQDERISGSAGEGLAYIFNEE